MLYRLLALNHGCTVKAVEGHVCTHSPAFVCLIPLKPDTGKTSTTFYLLFLWLAMLASNATSTFHSPPINYQCWLPLPVVINAGYQYYLSLPFQWLSTLATMLPLNPNPLAISNYCSYISNKRKILFSTSSSKNISSYYYETGEIKPSKYIEKESNVRVHISEHWTC